MGQIDKNTVSAKGQLKEARYVYFEGLENAGLRVMFVGNSITLHGTRPEIGWTNRWGMAASAKEKDYVHLCISKIREQHPDSSFCICQVSEWESNYRKGTEKYFLYERARAFRADIIVMRAVENCPKGDYQKAEFMRQYGGLVDYLNPDGDAAVILTTGFWKHPADEGIRAYAKEKGFILCELGDLGEREDMKAIGKFEHSGVANHPGDLGMQHIADRICQAIDEINRR